MATLVIPFTFSPATTISSTQVNQNFSAIASVVNGSLNYQNIIMTDTRGSGVTSWAANVTGDTNPRIAMNTSNGIQGGAGNAAMDVQLKRSAANTWQLSTVGGTAAILDMTGSTIVKTPSIIHNCGRLYGITSAPYQDTGTGGVGSIFYGPDNTGNVITLQETSTNQLVTQTFSQATLSVTLSDGVYDVYVNTASTTTVALSAVVWGGINTPPTRGTDVAGRLTKNAAADFLLVGVIRVLSNLTYDHAGTASLGTRRYITNIYNRVSKSFGCGPVNYGGITSTYPAVASVTDNFLAPYANGPQGVSAVVIGQLQNDTLNGISAIGISLNNNATPFQGTPFQAYAVNALGCASAAVYGTAQAGVNTVYTFLGRQTGVTVTYAANVVNGLIDV